MLDSGESTERTLGPDDPPVQGCASIRFADSLHGVASAGAVTQSPVRVNLVMNPRIGLQGGTSSDSSLRASKTDLAQTLTVLETKRKQMQSRGVSPLPDQDTKAAGSFVANVAAPQAGEVGRASTDIPAEVSSAARTQIMLSSPVQIAKPIKKPSRYDNIAQNMLKRASAQEVIVV